jgi:PKD repeat protein
MAVVLLPIKQTHAQINCAFTLVKDTIVLPGPILATATETSPWPITARKWTLTTCNGSLVNTTALAINANYSFVPNQPGCYCLQLWSQNSQGDTCITSNCNIFIIDTPKVNSITVTPNQICPPQTVTLTMQTSPGCGQIDSTIIMWGCGNVSYFSGNVTNATHVYTANCWLQCYDINVKLINSCGASGTKKVYDAVCLNDITANFTTNNNTAVCTNSLTNTMVADSAGTGVTYCWYVDNVQMQCSNSRYFTHTYVANVNCYSIKLIVSKPTGCVDSMVKQNYVCVYSQPQLSFYSNTNEICIDSSQSYTFCLHNTSGPVHPSPKWIITGPLGFIYGPVTGDTICFNTNRFGNYTVKMMGDYGANCKDTVVFTNALKLKQNPVPCFYANDTFNCQPPLTAQFTNCTSTTPGSVCVWTLGYDVVPQTTSFCTPPPITYNNWGRYTVSLTTTTPEGCSKSITKPDYVIIDSIKPSFAINNGYGCVPKIATCISTTYVPIGYEPVITYKWEVFNENGGLAGISYSGAYPRNYTVPGCYSVRLTCITASGCTTTAYKENAMCFGIPPVCGLNVSDDTTCLGDTITFSINCQNNFNGIRVHFGDEITDSVTSYYTNSPIKHRYSASGIFEMWAVALSDSCPGDTMRKQIVVYPPLANFIPQTSCLTGDTVFLQNTSVGANRYHWQVNCTGDTFNTTSLRLPLPHCDTCTISLTAYNDSTGCANTNQQLTATACNGVAASFEYNAANAMQCGTTQLTFTNTTPGSNSGQTIWNWDVAIDNIITNAAQCQGSSCSIGNTTTKTLLPGYHKVTMVYIAPGGCIDTAIKNIPVCDVSLDFTPTQVCLPDSFYLNPIIIDPAGHGCDSIISYNWIFDETMSSNLKKPSVYFNFGQHSVTLITTNANGCTDTITKIVAATTPVYDYIEIDTNICPGSTVCITNLTTSGAIMNEIWHFPGSNVSVYSGHNPPCVTYYTDGEYQITYHINSGICNMEKVFNMHVHQPELCGYVSASYFDCPNPPVSVCATNCSQYVDPITDIFTWNFGNSEYLEENPCNFYSFPGCYPVTLSVVTNNGCTDTITIDTVCIGGPYISSYTVTPISLCACKDTVHFTIATVGATQLTFISGCNQGFHMINPIIPVGSATNPTILTFDVPYCNVDSCQPQLTLGNASGCFTLFNLPWIYIDTPTANFGISTALCSNNEVCFTDSSFNYVDPNGNNWLWNFGDANDTATSNLQNPCHTYSHPGTYTVTLIAKPNSKCSDTTSRTITILPSPGANFNYTLTDTCKQAYYCFTDASTPVANTTITNWKWCYNDTTCYNTGNSTCYGFATEGTYQVKLQVTDSRGCKADTTLNIIANSIHHIQALADVTVTDSCFYSVICMTDLSTSESLVTNRLWYYISNVSTAPNKCFNVYNQGYYDIALLITDAAGCKDTFATGAIANPLITNAAFSYSVSGNLVLFTNQSSDFDNLTWLFGDNTTASINNPDHVYATPGTYQVTLIAQNDNCIDSSTQSVIVTGAIEPVDTICGIVYTDVFGNGQYENNTDIPLSGRLVTAGTYSAVTNQAGYYEMRLPANNYQLQVQAAPNTAFTQPVAGYYNVTSVGSGQKICNYNFGVEDTTTAIDGPEKDIKLVVMPNPFSDYTTITISGEKNVYSFGLHNTIGDQVAEQNIVTGQPLILQRNSLPAGVYIYTISKNGQGKGRGKLIIE